MVAIKKDVNIDEAFNAATTGCALTVLNDSITCTYSDELPAANSHPVIAEPLRFHSTGVIFFRTIH
jgi:hypothetical protein